MRPVFDPTPDRIRKPRDIDVDSPGTADHDELVVEPGALRLSSATLPSQMLVLGLLAAVGLSAAPARVGFDRLADQLGGLAASGVHALRQEIGLVAEVLTGRTAAARRAARDGVERDLVVRLVREHRPRAGGGDLRRLADLIRSEARAAGVDPLLVGAMTAEESSFHEASVSEAGAVGLMQLRPFVAEDLALRLEVGWVGEEALLDPEVNLHLGIRYFQELVTTFDGNLEKALTAYNWGPGRVQERMREGTYADSRFAQRVLRSYASLDAQRRARLEGVESSPIYLPVLRLALAYLT